METTVKKGERVRASSSKKENSQIDQHIMKQLKKYQRNPEEIEGRIKALDKAWDIERTLELNAAALALTGTLLGAFVNKKWFILPAAVTAFLAQHAIQGWCPPLPLFRKMGIKTRPELDREKYALKSIRGDFENASTANKAWKAVNK